MLKKKLTIFSLVFVFCTLPGYSQTLTDNGPYLTWFDSQVGIGNTGLFEGILYKEQYRTINQLTQFFKTTEFLNGSLVYKGQPYTGQRLKYDVFSDELLIKVADRLGGNTLKLFGDKITEFIVDGHHFIRVSRAPSESGITGFYEVSLDAAAFRLLTKHRKKLFDRKDRSSLYYEFLEGKKEHVVLYQGNYHPIENKRDVVRLFPALEKEINNFYNRARAQRRTDAHAFTIALMTRIASLLPSPKSDAL